MRKTHLREMRVSRHGNISVRRNIHSRTALVPLMGLLALALLALSLLESDTASAQPIAEWRRVVGGIGDESAQAIAIAGDGGYVIAGDTSSIGAGTQNGWLVKLDVHGRREWDRTFGGSGSDSFNDVQRTADGGYVLAGETHSSQGSSLAQSDFWLLKTDSSGEVEWEHSFGNFVQPDPLSKTTTSDVAHSVRQTRDGGFIVAGSSNGSTGDNVWLVRTGPTGRLLWGRNPGGASGAVAYDVVQASDGGFVIAGRSTSINSGTEALLIKTDSDGNTEWTKTFGDQFNEEARSLVLTKDGGYAMGGFSWSFGQGLSDYWLIKTDGNGRREWHRSYGGIANDSAYSLIQTSDGGFALAGESDSFSSDERTWVVKTDSAGMLEWTRAYSQTSSPLSPTAGTLPGGANAIKQTEDLGFVISGWTGRTSDTRDILAMKTAPLRELPILPEGPTAILENTGETPITAAFAAFSSGISSQEPAPLGFWYRGRVLSRENPLPVGMFACSQPTGNLASAERLEQVQIGASGALHRSVFTNQDATRSIVIDDDGEKVGFESDGREISATLSVVSESPCMAVDRRVREGPSAPTGLVAAVPVQEADTIRLNWNDNPESDVQGYGVYFSSSSSGPFQRIAWKVQDTGYLDVRKGDGSAYYYGVSAIDVRGMESPLSPVAEVRSADHTPPEPPVGLQLARVDRGNEGSRLEWDASPSADVVAYRVYLQEIGDSRGPILGTVSGTLNFDLGLPAQSDTTYSITAVDLAGNESDFSNVVPTPRDFFGTVLRVISTSPNRGQLAVGTDRGHFIVLVTSEAELASNGLTEPALENIRPGDRVAISLAGEGSVARQVHVIPQVGRHEQLAGIVQQASGGEVVIQPSTEGRERLIVPLTEEVLVTSHREAMDLVPGSMVVVSHTGREQDSSFAISEINVVPGRAQRDRRDEPIATPEPTHTAVVGGRFEGLTENNNGILVSSIQLYLDVNTTMQSGLTAGDAVLVDAILEQDGTLLARRVRDDPEAYTGPTSTILSGVFEGQNSNTGNWTVSGSEILTDRLTRIQSSPEAGQRVWVSGVLQEDATLYATEIRTIAPTEELDPYRLVRIEGTLLEIAPEGFWDIGGIPVNVDGGTELTGRPSLGMRVSAVATYADNTILASRIVGESTSPGQLTSRVDIRGEVSARQGDNALAVGGIMVYMSNLTRATGNIEVGSAVNVAAVVDSPGTLVAREIRELAQGVSSLEDAGNPVNIEGEIDRLLTAGSLLINGIPVNVSTLTEIDASIQPGATVQVRGLLRRDGSVLARQILGFGRSVGEGTEARLSGAVSRVHNDITGRPTRFELGGIPVSVDQLTRIEGEVVSGEAAEVHAIVVDGTILAASVRSPAPGRAARRLSVQMQGVVEDMASGPVPLPLDISVNGVQVRIAADTQIIGSLTEGAVVRTGGQVSEGIFMAEEIERIASVDRQAPQLSARFRIQGRLQEANLDNEGRPDRLLVSGERIMVEALSEFRHDIFVGNEVAVEGIIRDGTLVATIVGLAEIGNEAPET